MSGAPFLSRIVLHFSSSIVIVFSIILFISFVANILCILYTYLSAEQTPLFKHPDIMYVDFK